MNWSAAIWTLISVGGIAVSVGGLHDIADDRRALGVRDGALHLLIATRARRQYIRLGAFVIYTVIGLDTLSPLRFAGEDILLLVGLFGGLMALILNALLEQVDRATIRRLFP